MLGPDRSSLLKVVWYDVPVPRAVKRGSRPGRTGNRGETLWDFAMKQKVGKRDGNGKGGIDNGCAWMWSRR